MIILDTNVISEMMRPEPHHSVRQWLDAQEIETLFLTSVTVAELLYGVAAMPSGKRKNRLVEYTVQLQEIFADRVLAFDLPAARQHAKLSIAARKFGKGFPTPDGYIAAIAASRKFIIATRDVAPFKAVGLSVVDPWMDM